MTENQKPAHETWAELPTVTTPSDVPPGTPETWIADRRSEHHERVSNTRLTKLHPHLELGELGTAEDAVADLALGQALAEAIGHSRGTGIREALELGATWDQVGQALGSTPDVVRAELLRWADGQRHLFAETGRFGLGQEAYDAVVVLVNQQPETETGNPWGSARPWLTADTVVIRGNSVLLIQRADEPYQGSWALPGGYINEGETSRAGAARELEEETGIVAMQEELTQVGTYDAPDRDPRERVVTIAYLLEVASGVTAVAGDDAANAAWFPLDELPQLAFDHAEILADAVRSLA